MTRYRRRNSANRINNQLAHYTKVLAIATIILTISTIFLVYFNYNLSSSNEKLTNITTEFYSYHPPDVSLIKGMILKLYVLRDNNSGTYLTVVGVSSVYNSAQSDDIAVVRQKNLGKSYSFENLKMTIYEVQPNLITSYDLESQLNDTIDIEGIPFPIPVKPGDLPRKIPTLITYHMGNNIDLNTTCNISIKGNTSQTSNIHTFSKNLLTNQITMEPVLSACNITMKANITNIEVIHPISKKIMANLTTAEPVDIKYVVGQDIAHVNLNASTYSIGVRYTEDKEIYLNWKRRFLASYGTVSITT